ncbi:uncharacterized protein LACBIDRAFT_314894 [Laccaria bicolor S238N-H82]|uniref:Predicted protein n=1 Tax=Laccaria bicolor (strain S238N-H82 / ATCC MYA-4686) TaxID=486041 RepID=B0DZF1_LACBS|nr:uncharacterized protein LACBIDRAFT_314894 [Laccaria bicolor S238N-H82]EDR00004.1 predicted protein [Laccaria bicolor S238N-H82]|eukprot:XP_001889313.1 predicted protein [Laccaria bicolor S238N-H82]
MVMRAMGITMNLSHVIASSQSSNPYTNVSCPINTSYTSSRQPISPLQTHQYTVTHYSRIGIFKFDLDPLVVRS